jgi:hypothetical protein
LGVTTVTLTVMLAGPADPPPLLKPSLDRGLEQLRAELQRSVDDDTFVSVWPEDHDVVGPLGLPYTEVGGVAQSLGGALIDRGHDAGVVVARLRAWANSSEVGWWETTLGPTVDALAEAIGLTPFPDEVTER